MTVFIVIFTSLISILAFSRPELMYKFQFNPFQVHHRKQYYRMLTHGLLHADWVHLIINMLVLLSFGTAVEHYFGRLESTGSLKFPGLIFILLYGGAVVVSSLTTLRKYKDNSMYNSVGASGGVSAVIFTSIFFAPWQNLLLYAIIPIPGILFGVLYLAYSHYMSKKASDNINHDAHFIGAVYGLVFPLFIDISLLGTFIEQLFRL
ncbi:MAG: rhomboid family intramembrane serine protease [Bacteroidales bacterium]